MLTVGGLIWQVKTLSSDVDELRDKGQKVGLVRVKTFRPFPKAALAAALKGAKQIAVVEKGGSFGAGGILTPEIKEALYDAGLKIPVSGFCVQLGGREIAADGIREIIERVSGGEKQKAYEYFRLKKELLPDLVP